MPARTIALAATATLGLLLAGCSQASDEPGSAEAASAGEPVTASPDTAGVPSAELETRQSVNQLGTSAQALVQATDLSAARDALGTLEQTLGSVGKSLPENLATGVEADLQSARDALAADDLAAAKVAGNAIIERMRTSATLTDPTLVRPAGEEQAQGAAGVRRAGEMGQTPEQARGAAQSGSGNSGN